MNNTQLSRVGFKISPNKKGVASTSNGSDTFDKGDRGSKSQATFGMWGMNLETPASGLLNIKAGGEISEVASPQQTLSAISPGIDKKTNNFWSNIKKSLSSELLKSKDASRPSFSLNNKGKSPKKKSTALVKLELCEVDKICVFNEIEILRLLEARNMD